MSSSRHGYRWDYYRRDPRQAPLDSLNNWEGRAHAQVTWNMDHYRERDNTVTHIAVPVVSCEQHHTVGDDVLPHVRRVCDNPRNSYFIVERALIEWLGHQGQQLLEFTYDGGYDQLGRHVVWATSYVSRLEHLPIQSCEGRGRSAKDAKHQAALALLNSSHCMIRLPR